MDANDTRQFTSEHQSQTVLINRQGSTHEHMCSSAKDTCGAAHSFRYAGDGGQHWSFPKPPHLEFKLMPLQITIFFRAFFNCTEVQDACKDLISSITKIVIIKFFNNLHDVWFSKSKSTSSNTSVFANSLQLQKCKRWLHLCM